jgi:threonyl-tRNA synthetase
MSLQNQEQLNELRHSAAHLLAAAVMQLYPNAKRTIGPSIEHGFYYDFDFGEDKVSETDLPKIEKVMRKLAPTWKEFVKNELPVEAVKDEFKDNEYKIELINEHAGAGEVLTVYQSGEFRDLCRGGHVEEPNKALKFFKLLSIAGAYWRGNEKNKMLTRIYGTAFFSQEELDAYVLQQAEAKKRDHRKLGKELELFLLSPSVGAGFPLYMPNGWLLRHALEDWIISEKQKRGYNFVWTPHVGKSDLYKQSGHWQKYDAMMSPMKIDDEEYVVKPMNCPHHFQIFNETPHSYRDLPLRLAENATVYRYEQAGEVNGLLRVRSLTQDDTHTFVRHNQISEEIDRIIELVKHTYKTFGFSEYKARISVRDPKNPDKYLGTPKVWDDAEYALEEAAKRHNFPYFIGEGEAAFYGPKIDVMVKDALGREWQLTTVQLDFNQPENFDMTYTNEKGEKERPAVLHIAILGSIDRFLAILIEQYAGAFPLWLAPTQVAILPISEHELEYAQSIQKALAAEGLRLNLDESANTLGKKMVNARTWKVPYMAILGKQEVENKTITLKNRAGEQITLTMDECIAKLKQEVVSKI